MTGFVAAALALSQVGHPAEAPLARLAATELAALRPAVTPSAWLRTHPDDRLLTFRREAIRENHDGWCARTSRIEQSGDGSRMIRYAYFYPPRPHALLALPATGGPELLREQCVLGAVWIEAAVADSASGSALAAAVRDELTLAYGPVRAGPDVFFGRVPTDSQRRLFHACPARTRCCSGFTTSARPPGGPLVGGRWTRP